MVGEEGEHGRLTSAPGLESGAGLIFLLILVIIFLIVIAAAAGLFIGTFYHPFLLVSSGGLAMMMLVGLLVRIRIHDPVFALLPAFFFFCLNLFIFLYA